MTSTDIRSDILASNKHFMDAFGRGDAAGLAHLYTGGGQLLPPHSEVVAGREGVERGRSLTLTVQACRLCRVRPRRACSRARASARGPR